MNNIRIASILLALIVGCSGPDGSQIDAGSSPLGSAELRVIYGDDNRLDRYQVSGIVGTLADSTVALMNSGSVAWNGNGYNIYTAQSFADAYSPLCDTEPFRDQPATAWCSGFPVGPDLIATAGHCVGSGTCAAGGGSAAFVFGYHMTSSSTVRSNVGPDDVYFCEQIVDRVETATEDWAIVKLTRPLVGHAPLNFRRLDGADRIPTGTPVLVSGHPMGLPVKIAGGASVKNNSNTLYFDANVDTYGGNSGSPVVNADRLANNEILVEGILVRGATDLIVAGNCYASNVCSDTAGCYGDGSFEDITRTHLFADLVTVCGNDAREGGEMCDGADLGGATCADYGCTGGTVACTSSCGLDLSGCTGCPVCNNNGVCDAGETCLGCPADCISGNAGGAVCGNGVCEVGNGENCLTCSSDCAGKTGGKPSTRYCCGQDAGCDDSRCTANAECTALPVAGAEFCCGDTVCSTGETSDSCAIDCACQSDAGCDDGDACTTDACVAGACENTPQSCDDGNACTADSCSNGTCLNEVISCNDNNSCTDDACSEAVGCLHTDNGTCGTCESAGAACATNSDCCSNNCHPKKKTCK